MTTLLALTSWTVTGAILALAAAALLVQYLRQRIRVRVLTAESRLRATERRLRHLADAAQDAVIMLDPEGRISFWNPAAERILGYSRKEALGRNGHALFAPERFRASHAAAFEKFRGTGEGSAVGRTLELPALRKDGTELPVELSLSSVEIDGEWHAIGILRDVSLAKKTARRLKEEKERAEQLFRMVPSAVFTVDRECRITSLNRQAVALLGYSPEELLGRSCTAFTMDACRSPCALFDEEVEKPAYGVECTVRAKDGRILTVLKNLDVLRNAEGEVVGGVESFTDITSRKKMEEELRVARRAAEEAARAKSEFLANMSHEIRTPMNAVIGMTGLLLRTDLDEEQREFAETIRRSGDQLLALINDILDFSKIESGKLELEEQPFDLRTAVEDALDLVVPQAQGRGIELAVDFRPGTPERIVGDVTRLRQILLNLLSNAVKFTEEGEVVVTVQARPDGDGRQRLRLSVRDTGIGIPRDRLDRLFESFSQADASTTRLFGGTGLGLAISRRLAEKMAGSLEVESEEGKGTTFHLEIPVRTAPGPIRSFLGEEPRLAGRRLLVVDDNATNRRILRLQAESWGMEARDFATGAEALAALRDGERFDLAVLDLQMPGMDGKALAREIRREPGARGMPLVLLTSLPYAKEEGKPAGPDPDLFDATLMKPVKPSRLFDLIIDLLLEPRRGPTADRGEAAEAAPGRSDLRILLAEDNVVNQKVALRILEKLGHSADLAGNGLEAVAALHRQPYDIVLMDVQMPELDGLAATRRIRADLPPDRQPWIIAMTANALEGDREKCLTAGMDDYVSKPVRVVALQKALEKGAAAVGSRGKRRARRGEAEDAVPDPAPDAPPAVDTAFLDDLREGEEPGEEPGIVEELVQIFLEDTPLQIDGMRRAASAGDAEGLHRAAHTLKGSSASIGAGPLSALCQEVDLLAKKGTTEGVEPLLEKIEAEFARVREALSAIRV